MKTTTTTTAIAAMLTQAFPAHAATGAATGHIFMTAFLGFAALIIVFQLVPAIMLFSAMLKGLFSATPHNPEIGLEAKPRK